MRESKYQTDCYNIIHVVESLFDQFTFYNMNSCCRKSVSNRLLQHNSWVESKYSWEKVIQTATT